MSTASRPTVLAFQEMSSLYHHEIKEPYILFGPQQYCALAVLKHCRRGAALCSTGKGDQFEKFLLLYSSIARCAAAKIVSLFPQNTWCYLLSCPLSCVHNLNFVKVVPWGAKGKEVGQIGVGDYNFWKTSNGLLKWHVSFSRFWTNAAFVWKTSENQRKPEKTGALGRSYLAKEAVARALSCTARVTTET